LNAAVDDELSQLGRSLERRKWKEADRRTGQILREALRFDRDEQELIGLHRLEAVDALWSAASDGRFTVARQLRVFRDEAAQDPFRFATYVGWRRRNRFLLYSALNFDLSAPPGHLPVGGPDGLFGELGLDLGVGTELKEMWKAALPLYTKPGPMMRGAYMFAKAKVLGGRPSVGDMKAGGDYLERKGHLPAMQWLEGHIALFRRLADTAFAAD
jgi:hypothetical protein